MLRNGHAILHLISTLVIICLIGCGKSERTQETSGNVGPADKVAVLHDSMLAKIAVEADPATGWPSATDCDALLWSGLAVASGVQGIKLEQAEYLPGEIHRRPMPSCWNEVEGDVGSKSTISQDMLTGYLWGLWRTGDLAAVQRLAAYGEAHKAALGWVMGKPYPERVGEVVMRGNLIGLVGRMLFELSGGYDDRSYRHDTTLYLPVEADYQKHIMVLGILLQGETRRPVVPLVDIDGQELERLRELSSAYPKDALFQAAMAIYSGDWTKTEELLLDEGYECPSYARGAEIYCEVHIAFAASLLLKYNQGEI